MPSIDQILGTRAQQVVYDEPKTFHLPDWGKISDPQRIAILRRIVLTYGRDPRIANLTVGILQTNGVADRQYGRQAAVLLKWVQDNINYLNEPGERLQSPDYTLRVKYGDCDDKAILLAAMLESIKLPWKFVLSGLHGKTRQKVRWAEGDPPIYGILWTHIYLAIGDKPFSPSSWTYAEPTLRGAPLGWDVVDAKNAVLPEMSSEMGWVAIGGSAGAGGQVAAEVASNPDDGRGTAGINWKQVAVAVVVGVSVTVLSQVVLDQLGVRRSHA